MKRKFNFPPIISSPSDSQPASDAYPEYQAQDAPAYQEYADEAPEETLYDAAPQEWEESAEYSPSGSWLGEEAPEEEKPPKRTIFKPRTRKPSFILAVLVNSFRMLVLMILIFGLAGLGAVVGVAKAYMETAPTLDLAAIDDQAQTSFIYDADGNLITDYKGTENRIMVSITTMPLTLQHAFVAVEDARFYTHNGVDVKRIVGAFVANPAVRVPLYCLGTNFC